MSQQPCGVSRSQTFSQLVRGHAVNCRAGGSCQLLNILRITQHSEEMLNILRITQNSENFSTVFELLNILGITPKSEIYPTV